MSTDPKAAMLNGTLNPRDYDRVLSSVRLTAQRIQKLVEALEEDGARLNGGNHPAPASIVEEAATTIRVGLQHLLDIFTVKL